MKSKNTAWERYERAQRRKNDDKQQKLFMDIEDEKREEEKKEVGKENERKEERFILGTEHNNTMQRTGKVGSRWTKWGRTSNVGQGRYNHRRGNKYASRDNNNLLLSLGFSEGMQTKYYLLNKEFYGRVNIYRQRETEKAYLVKAYIKSIGGRNITAEAWIPKSIVKKRGAMWIMKRLDEVLQNQNNQSQNKNQNQSQSQSYNQRQNQYQKQGGQRQNTQGQKINKQSRKMVSERKVEKSQQEQVQEEKLSAEELIREVVNQSMKKQVQDKKQDESTKNE